MIYLYDLPLDLVYYIFNLNINILLLVKSSKYFKNIVNIYCYERIVDYRFYKRGMNYYSYYFLLKDIENYDNSNNYDVNSCNSFFIKNKKIVSIGKDNIEYNILNDKIKVNSICAGYDNLSIITNDRELYFYKNKKLVKKELPNNCKVLKVANGYNHVIILDLNYKVYSFGNNDTGQLGLNDFDDRINPVLIDSVKNIQFMDISAGRNHSLLVSKNNDLYSFGWHRWGFLGRNNINTSIPIKINNIGKVSNAYASENFSIALTTDGEVYGFGINNYYEISEISKIIYFPIKLKLPFKVKLVCPGQDYIFFISDDNKLYARGNNLGGRLGLGNISVYKSVTNVKLKNTVCNIKSNFYHTIIQDINNEYYGFGSNHWDQLHNDDDEILFPREIDIKIE